MFDLGQLKKQAARMQKQMEQTQAQLALRTVEATSGGGAVKVTARCDGTLAAIKIDPQALNPGDAQIVEDMILAAVNEAHQKASSLAKERIAAITGGMNIPGLL